MHRSVTAILTLLGVVLFGSAAFAQIPSIGQIHAIRANCVEDYRKACSGIPTGGFASLVCLQQHESQLSSSCRSAVEAVGGGSRTSSGNTGRTITITPGTTSSRDAPKMSFGEELRIAADTCFHDFHIFCPDVPASHGNALFCLKVHGPKLEPACRRALIAAGESL